MKYALTRLFVIGSVYIGAASPLLAEVYRRPGIGHGKPKMKAVHSVPEIDASAGLLALAAVLAIMAFAWERRRRSA